MVLLPGCTCCGSTGCTCNKGTLPDTVTVEFKGLQGTKTQGPSLLALGFSSCFGSGAAGTVAGSGGDPGPISGVTLTSPGSGYAKLGRVAPTLSLSSSSSKAASVSIGLDKQADPCGVDYWSVKSLTVTDGGYGYTERGDLTISVAAGGTVEVAAKGKLHVKGVEPEIKAAASAGTGATFTVSLASNKDPEAAASVQETWRVDSISLGTSGTPTGYTDGDAIQFEYAGSVTCDSPASATLHTGRVEPTLALSVKSVTGSGAALSCTLSKVSDASSQDAWVVSSIAVEDGGSGYNAYDAVEASGSGSGQTIAGAPLWAIVSAVDSSGAITGASIFNGGLYWKSDGIPTGVTVEDGGAYSIAGVLTGVTITDGGRYYRESANEPPYVADVTAAILQASPSKGSGATVSVTVESSTSSPNFGKISSISLSSAGSNYLAWAWEYDCNCQWDQDNWTSDHTVVAYRTSPTSCEYFAGRCGIANSLGQPLLVHFRISSCLKTQTIPVSAPSGIPGVHNGPIFSFPDGSYPVTSTGWALPGRKAPTASRIDGNATIEPLTLTKKDGTTSCPIYYWEATGVTITNGGYGYSLGQTVGIGMSNAEAAACSNSYSDPSLSPRQATAVVSSITRVAPPLSATIVDYNPPAMTVSVSSNGDSPETWGVSAVSISAANVSWFINDFYDVVISPSGGSITTVTPAVAVLRLVREQPQITATVLSSLGTGAVLGVSLSQITDPGGDAAWAVSSLTITNGGSQYAVGDVILFSGAPYAPYGSYFSASGYSPASATVTKNSPTGEILEVLLTSGGTYYKTSGVVDRVVVLQPGSYYRGGVIQSLSITDPGKFFCDDTATPPIIPPVTVEILQSLPSQGAGAEVTASVGDGTTDTLGKLSLNVVNTGSGYLSASTWVRAPVVVRYPGPNSPPVVQMMCHEANGIGGIDANTARIVLTADDPITDCDNFSFTAKYGEGTATVTPGGSITPVFRGSNKCCGRCYVNCPEKLTQVTIHFHREASEGFANDELGWYVSCPEDEAEYVFDWDQLKDLCEIRLGRTAPENTCTTETLPYGFSGGFCNDYLARVGVGFDIFGFRFGESDANADLGAYVNYGFPDGVVGTYVYKTETYTPRFSQNQYCKSFPDGWDLVTIDDPAWAVGSTHLEYPFTAPVGVAPQPIEYRRVCKDYTVDISVQ